MYRSKAASALTFIAMLITSTPAERASAHPFACTEAFQPKFLEDVTVEAWLNWKIDFHGTTQKPNSLVVNGRQYDGLIELGQGAEGTVYLAKAVHQQEVVIKVFHSKENYARAIRENHTYARWLPKVIERDPLSRSMITEYRAGIPVYDIYKRGERFGFGPERQADIMRRFDEWTAIQRAAILPPFESHPSFIARNVIFSIAEKKFYLIDAF